MCYITDPHPHCPQNSPEDKVGLAKTNCMQPRSCLSPGPRKMMKLISLPRPLPRPGPPLPPAPGPDVALISSFQRTHQARSRLNVLTSGSREKPSFCTVTGSQDTLIFLHYSSPGLRPGVAGLTLWLLSWQDED